MSRQVVANLVKECTVVALFNSPQVHHLIAESSDKRATRRERKLLILGKSLSVRQGSAAYADRGDFHNIIRDCPNKSARHSVRRKRLKTPIGQNTHFRPHGLEWQA